MAVPISATNSTRRSLSHHGVPERSHGGQRKTSDSFFTSLFSTRKLHRKAHSGSCTELSGRANEVTPKSYVTTGMPPISSAVNSSVAAKPPTGNRRVIPSGPTVHKQSLRNTNYRRSEDINESSKKISSSTPSSPFRERREIGKNTAQSPAVYVPLAQAPDTQIPRRKQTPITQITIAGPTPEDHPKRSTRPGSTITSFIRRSLSRSKSKQRTPDEDIPSPSSVAPIRQQQQLVSPPSPNISPQQLTFAQRIKLHKGIRTGQVPVELLSKQILLQKERHDRRQQKSSKKSTDEFTQQQTGSKNFPPLDANIDSTMYLAEALFALGDTQPLVARSVPKVDHTHPIAVRRNKGIYGGNPEYNRNKKRADERLQRNCIFEPEFYDQMLTDSLDVCAQLQTHLTGCINGVRAHSPTALSSPFSSQPTTPIMKRSRSTQPNLPGQNMQNVFGTTTTFSLSPPPPSIGTTPSPLPPSSHILRNSCNDPVQSRVLRTPPQTDPRQRKQKYSYYTGLGASSKSPTPAYFNLPAYQLQNADENITQPGINYYDEIDYKTSPKYRLMNTFYPGSLSHITNTRNYPLLFDQYDTVQQRKMTNVHFATDSNNKL